MRFFAALVVFGCGSSEVVPLPIARFDASAPVIDAGVVDARVDAGGATHLRVVAANTSSGPNLDYTPLASVRILQGLHPDLVMIQEFKVGGNTQGELDGFVSSTFGAEFTYFRESGVTIPNGVISRYPIVESGRWVDPNVNDRGFAWAKIAVPGSKALWAVSLHLLTTSSGARNSQAAALVAEVKNKIPAADYLVIGGDLNTGGRQEACVTTLAEIVETSSAVPDDGAGNDNTNAPRNKPHDWVLADADLAPLQIATVLGTRSFAAGIVFDSRVYTPLTDVAPVMMGDSGNQNTQHMPVVKDFRLP